jgi:hypothetical protein
MNDDLTTAIDDQSIPDLQRRLSALESKFANLLLILMLVVFFAAGIAAIVAKFVK